jgi:hypothetical protein
LYKNVKIFFCFVTQTSKSMNIVEVGGLHLVLYFEKVSNLRLLSLYQGRKLLPLSTSGGLSPLCFAIINGQTAIIEEYFQHRVAKKAIYFQSDVVKQTKQTIPHLLFQFAPLVHPKVLLKRKEEDIKCRLLIIRISKY